MKRVSELIMSLLLLSIAIVASAAESKPSWQREWDKIIEGAKKEGEVRLWGEQEITHTDIIAAFNKEFPFIKAVTVSGRVGDLMPRIIAERRAGKFLADIYSGGLGGRSFYDFLKAGVLDPIKPVLLLPEVVDASKWLNGEHYYADSEKQFVFMYEGSVAGNGLHYNTGLVDLKDFKSYWELLNPKWKGKILLFERPGVGSPSVIRFYHHAQLGPEFIKRLFDEMDVTVSQDRRQSSDWLASGKFPICIDCGDTDRAKRQGLPVDEFPQANLKEASYEVSTSGNSFFRSHTHLPLWEILEQAGFWKQVGIKVNWEFCDSSSEAEAALFSGKIDLISGNHISPYALVAKGKPIVSLASPTNGVNDTVVSREPIKSLAEIRGQRVVDTTILDNGGGYNHIRGNHMLYILEAGLELSDVKWVEITDRMSSEFRAQQYEAMKAGEGDVTLVTGDTKRYQDAGFHILQLPRLPMINGPTLTTTVTALNKYDRFGERLVLSQVLGIHFGRTRKAETEKILEGLKKREPDARNVSYNSVAKLAIKPYPDIQAVANAYRLCCLKDPMAKELSPMSMWDLHFLRQLDNSGFIDGLYNAK